MQIQHVTVCKSPHSELILIISVITIWFYMSPAEVTLDNDANMLPLNGTLLFFGSPVPGECETD